ncbi:helix-turn-helix domain-containing protein [Achromobacter xylosoxidans]
MAAAEFAERGFQHTRISDIVARAGVTQPVFYQYFTSKQAAYDELVGMFAKRLRGIIGQEREPGAPGSGLDERVRASVGGLLAILRENPDLTRIGFFQADSVGSQGRTGAHDRGQVRLEQQAGLFRAEVSAELFAHALMGIIERFVRRRRGRNPRRCRDSSRTCCWTARAAARRRRACPPDAAPALTDP